MHDEHVAAVVLVPEAQDLLRLGRRSRPRRSIFAVREAERPEPGEPAQTASTSGRPASRPAACGSRHGARAAGTGRVGRLGGVGAAVARRRRSGSGRRHAAMLLAPSPSARDRSGLAVSDAQAPGRVAARRRRRWATPGDASPRLRDGAGAAPVIAAEDTRRLRRLCRRPRRRRRPGGSCRSSRATRPPGCPQLLDALRAGRGRAAGHRRRMPSVSDPGYRLVVAAVAAGIAVTALPGPVGGADRARRVRAAGRPVLLRGVPAAQGRASGARALAALAAEPRTLVFFEAPHRLAGDAGATGRRRSAPTGRRRSAAS